MWFASSLWPSVKGMAAMASVICLSVLQTLTNMMIKKMKKIPSDITGKMSTFSIVLNTSLSMAY